MDCCRNVSVSAGEYYQPEQALSPPCAANLDDLFSTHNTEVDVSLEWLSIFVEDCLTSPGNCLPPVAKTPNVQVEPQIAATDPEPADISKAQPLLQKGKPSSSLQKSVVPGKARSKRKKRSTATAKPSNSNHFMGWTKNQNLHHMMTSSDPLLLQQAYWLADSELILPQKEEESNKIIKDDHHETKKREGFDVEEERFAESLDLGNGGQGQGQARRCTHCLSQRTPQWRAGPLGPKTLCNACGVRYKSGRLLPEYRPAKSPTFVTNLHSNSHKKVLEMRNMGVGVCDDLGVLHSG